jgi:hypothetical protein
MMALIGYEAERAKIDAAITNLKALLGRGVPVDGLEPSILKRKIGAAAQKRMAAAQPKRWAEYRRQNAPGTKKTAERKPVAPQVLQKRLAGLAKARAARAAKRAATKA